MHTIQNYEKVKESKHDMEVQTDIQGNELQVQESKEQQTTLPENPYEGATNHMVGYWTDGTITYYMNSFVKDNEYVFFYTKADEEDNWYKFEISEMTDEHMDRQQEKYFNDTLYVTITDTKGNTQEAEMNLLRDRWNDMYYLYIDTEEGQTALKKLPPYLNLGYEVKHVVPYIKFVDLTVDEAGKIHLEKKEIGYVDSYASMTVDHTDRYILYDSANPTGYYYFQDKGNGLLYHGYIEEKNFVEKIIVPISKVEDTPEYASWQPVIIENPLLDYEVVEKGYDIFSGYTVEDDFGNIYLYTNGENQRMTRYELNSHYMEFTIDETHFGAELISGEAFNEKAMSANSVPKYLEADVEAYRVEEPSCYYVYGNGLYFEVDTNGADISLEQCRKLTNCLTLTTEKKDLEAYARTITFNGWSFAENACITILEQSPDTNTGFSLIGGTVVEDGATFGYFLDKSIEKATSGDDYKYVYENPYSDELEMQIICTDYTNEYNSLVVGVMRRPQEYIYIHTSSNSDSPDYCVYQLGELFGLNAE